MLFDLLRHFRKQVLILFDVCIITVAYVVPWVLINGRVQYRDYASLLVASCFFFVCCYEIVYGLFGMLFFVTALHWGLSLLSGRKVVICSSRTGKRPRWWTRRCS